jgi:hypothetical protein
MHLSAELWWKIDLLSETLLIFSSYAGGFCKVPAITAL